MVSKAQHPKHVVHIASIESILKPVLDKRPGKVNAFCEIPEPHKLVPN